MNLKIIKVIGDSRIANVYLAKTPEDKYLEFVESMQPPLSRKDKWVLVVSVLSGCPVGCLICDAGSVYKGRLSKEEIFAQIDYLVERYYPERSIDCKEFKIQFARMGEPVLNPALLEVLGELPERYECKGLLPAFSTVAPKGSDDFLSQLLTIKNSLYSSGSFQMQFSIHSTNQEVRDRLIPIEKWDFQKIASYCENFYVDGDKKIALNFALAKEIPFCVKELKRYFSPEVFVVKITPVNPTIGAMTNNMESYFTTGDSGEDVANFVDQLHNAGYESIISIGEFEENRIGSNCGQYVKKFIMSCSSSMDKDAYSYVIGGHPTTRNRFGT